MNYYSIIIIFLYKYKYKYLMFSMQFAPFFLKKSHIFALILCFPTDQQFDKQPFDCCGIIIMQGAWIRLLLFVLLFINLMQNCIYSYMLPYNSTSLLYVQFTNRYNSFTFLRLYNFNALFNIIK